MSSLRNIFGSDAKNYDKYRPRYTKELFDTILAHTDGRKAVEIGPGSGQATDWLLNKGFDITCCEISRDFCSFLAEKYKNFPVSVVNKPFEEFEAENENFDLVFSATAFHWVDRDTGFSKAKKLLKKGGTLALFWNVPVGAYDNEALHYDIQKAYGSGRKWEPRPAEKYGFCREYMEKYGFRDMGKYVFHGRRGLTAREYLALLETYSDHKSMEQDKKAVLYDKIAAAIEKHGGYINIMDSMELYIARR